jgi:POT family proton-dependent oligopeptide transporter
MFWALYEQAGSSLNLFAERNTNRNLFGFLFPASWYQFVEPLFVILLAPVLAWLWIRLGRRDPASPTKFAMGLAFVAAGYLIMLPPAALSSSGRLAGPYWLVLLYLLHSIGELCLSPVGLSAMTKLAPQRLAGLMMGVWFVSLGIGNFLAGRIASFYGAYPLTKIFGLCAVVVFVAAAAMALMVRPTVRLMSGVK